MIRITRITVSCNFATCHSAHILEYIMFLQTFMVVAKDGTIYRFSATPSLHCLSATNAVRRTLVFACTHQYSL